MQLLSVLFFPRVDMDGMGPDWKGLLKWSMANSDGTQPAREIRYASLLSLKDFLERFFFSFFWCSHG